MFQAFPDDFTEVKNTTSCKENGTKAVKSFNCLDTARNPMIRKSLLQIDCELYCTLEDGCWGCMESCHELCQWNAIMHHDLNDYFENATVKTVTQKTGEKATNIELWKQLNDNFKS